MLFEKHTRLCAAMFFAFVPAFSEANSACTEAAQDFNLCLDDKIDQQLLYLNKYPNVDQTLIYYSGAILYNGPIGTPPLRSGDIGPSPSNALFTSITLPN